MREMEPERERESYREGRGGKREKVREIKGGGRMWELENFNYFWALSLSLFLILDM